MTSILQITYLITAFLLIIGVRGMASPKTARLGFLLSGLGMLVAILATLYFTFSKSFANIDLLVIAIIAGAGLAWYSGIKVKMIQMPQMIAIYNGMGGGAAAIISVLELIHAHQISLLMQSLALLSGLIGSISFSGSLIAFAKLQDLIKGIIVFPKHNLINFLLFVTGLVFGVLYLYQPAYSYLFWFYCSFLLLGIIASLPIGGANMPILISLFNALTGLAVAINGFVLNNLALVIAGTIVGASGVLLTQLMAKAMNKNVQGILFPPKQLSSQTSVQEGVDNLKSMDFYDAATLLAFASKVIIVPGYGMAVAQAQHKIKELTAQLALKGVSVKFAIHPVAGRMPGHMNVLLAEADIPYDSIFDLEEINPEFNTADVALIIGANDVVNPDALKEPDSPIYGMPILDAFAAKQVLVIKRGAGKGFSGVENSLFSMNNVYMLYGDAQDVVNKLIQDIKNL